MLCKTGLNGQYMIETPFQLSGFLDFYRLPIYGSEQLAAATHSRVLQFLYFNGLLGGGVGTWGFRRDLGFYARSFRGSMTPFIK